MSQHVADRLTAPGPKRVLAIDGGGVRGMIAIGFLEEIEAVLRRRHGRNDYVLADYFDMIGGTSVGSMLATMLALGWPVADVHRMFCEAAPDIFRPTLGRRGLLVPKFSDRSLGKHVDRILGTTRFEDPAFRTGLAIVTKRVDTGSPWVVYNNPNGKYWDDHVDPETGKRRVGNRHYRAADLIRASTAAPTYFKPHEIRIHELPGGTERPATFVDGGISPYNDPALLLLMMAGIRGYRLGGVETVFDERGTCVTRGIPWPLGPDKLFIVSVGTGDFRFVSRDRWWKPAMLLAGESLLSMISDTQATTLKMMQWLASPNKAWSINREVDDLRYDTLGQLLGAPQGMFSYARYNIRLDKAWLDQKLGVTHFSARRLRQLQRLDEVCELHTYQTLSRAAAARQVTSDDFPWQFDNPKCG